MSLRSCLLVLFTILLVGCAESARPPAPLAPQPAAPPAALDAVVRDPAPGQALPLVVALHGRGDRADTFIHALDGLDGARIVALRAPLPYGDGAAWLDGSVRQLDEATLASALRVQADAVVTRISAVTAAYPTHGLPVLTGFSQGAMVTWAVAALHPDRIAGAAPVAGLLPVSLLRAPTSRIPVRVLHGDADEVVTLARDQAAVEAATVAGMDVVLIPFPGVGHTIPEEVKTRWYAELRGMFPR